MSKSRNVHFVLAIAATFLLCFGNPQLASAQIAPGVQQSAAHTATITGSVKDASGKPVAGADVKLFGQGAVLSSRSDAGGAFTFTSVPWGTYTIAVFTSLGTATKANVAVSGDISVAIQFAPSSGLKTIASVSTKGAGASINVTSSSVYSVSPSESAFQGNGTWKDVLSQLPGVNWSGGTAGGASLFNTMPYAPQAPVILSLNGALPYETSTTLDGMPLQGTSANTFNGVGGGTDLSALPLNAFDTADIVRGPGANAPSIVDSIGGSFVLHAPGQVSTNRVEFSASNDPYGGIISNFKASERFGRLSATLIYGINDSPGPFGTEGSYMPNTTIYAGTKIDGRTVQSTTTTGPNPAKGIYNCYCIYQESVLMCCVRASSAWNVSNGALGIAYDVAPTVSAQVFYAGSTSRENMQQGYYPVEFQPSATYHGIYPASPPGQQTYWLPSITDLLTSQSSSLLEEKVTAYLGQGVLRLAALQNNTYFNTSYPAETASGTYQLWGTVNLGAKSPGVPTDFNGQWAKIQITPFNVTQGSSANNRDFLGSYALQVAPNTSAGVSYVQSYYNAPYNLQEFYNGSSIYSGGYSNSGSETTHETRFNVDSTFGKLDLGLSWYWAQGSFHVQQPQNPTQWTDSAFPYNAPRLGAVWRPNQNIAIRASAGGGFALPQLSNLVGFSISPSGNSYIETIANLHLKPEETFGFDVGSDIRLQRDTALSFDLYRTNLYGQFFSSTTTSEFKGEPLFITQIGNLGVSRYEGLNLQIHHEPAAGVYWAGTFGLTRGYVVSVPAGFYNGLEGYPYKPCTNCVNQYVVPGANFNSAAYPASVPYASAAATLGYRWNPRAYIDLSPTYYGNNNVYNTPHAFVGLDAHGSVPMTKNFALLATFRNITGAYDQSVQYVNPGYAVPVIAGAPPYSVGALYQLPLGPRTVILTANFIY